MFLNPLSGHVPPTSALFAKGSEAARNHSWFHSVFGKMSWHVAFHRDERNFLVNRLMTFIKLTKVEVRNARFFFFF